MADNSSNSVAIVAIIIIVIAAAIGFYFYSMNNPASGPASVVRETNVVTPSTNSGSTSVTTESTRSSQ